MSDRPQSPWARLAGFIIGYESTWIADIGLRTGSFHAIADAVKLGGTPLVAELHYPDSPETYRTEPAYRMLVADQPMPARVVMLASNPA